MICMSLVRAVAARRAVAVGLAVVALAACTKDNAPVPPGATLGTAAPTTTTTDPYAIPNPIDAAYVNRVLAGFDAVTGDVVRMMVATKNIPREAADRLKALYRTDAILNLRLDSISRDLAFRLDTFKPQPGNAVTTVSDLISAKPACVFAKVSRDYAAVSASPSSPVGIQWIAIVPLESSRDPSHYNPTGWSYIYEGFEPGRLPPQGDPCVAR